MKWRPSQLGKLMTNPRSKSEVLSETAKSEIRRIAKQDFYGFNTELRTKPMIKGTEWEQEALTYSTQLGSPTTLRMRIE